MSEISLKDLQQNKEVLNQPTQNMELVKQEVQADMVERGKELSPEQREKVDEIKNGLNIMDSNQTVTFGVGAQRNLAQFSDTILDKVKNKDIGDAGKLLSDLMVQVKDMEIDSIGESKGFLGILPGKLKRKIERFKNKFETVEVQIDKIEGQLDNARVEMMKDIAMYDELYSKNLEYFHSLNLYIIAGEEVIQEMTTVTIPKLRAEAQESGDPMNAQLVSDFEETVNRFEKKVHDLKLSKSMAMQTAPQIKLIQNNDKVLVDKIQTAILNTIPLWKSQIVIALGLARQENALKLQKSVTDTTNELLLKNSEKLKQNTIEVAKESERGIIEIETLKKTNRDLIDTIEETIKIHQEGYNQRQQAEKDLLLIEEELKQTLLKHRR
ncbi:MAG TPA: toxic anion resistance protein [Clostridiaceae bacterium]|nr:toxic anion resistance protein [Clostridiaceae bacterium]